MKTRVIIIIPKPLLEKARTLAQKLLHDNQYTFRI